MLFRSIGPSPSATLAACWREALRLHPPAYLLSREVRERVEITGRSLAPGDQVFLFLPLPHRDSRWFAAPDAFRPERFLQPAEQPVAAGGGLPFGEGPRGCAGESWAGQLTQQLLVPVLRQHRLTLRAETPEPRARYGFALAAEAPVWVERGSR